MNISFPVRTGKVNMKKFLKSRKRGSALPLAMLIIVLLLIVGGGLLSLGLNARIISTQNARQIVAQCAADAGLTKALYEMNEKLKVQPWSDNDLPVSFNECLLICNAVFSYTISDYPNNGYMIESTGICGHNTRTVHAILQLQGPFEYAIAIKENMVLKPGSLIDGYNFANEAEKLQIATKSILPAQVNIGLNALVDGDVAVGVGGDPEKVICAPGATITGRTYALTKDVEFPSVTVPQWLQDLPAQAVISTPATISSSAKYDGINLGQGDVLTIDGPVVLYVTGNIGLMNSAQIQINEANPDAYLVLYLGGDVYCKNGGAINNLTKDPAKLRIFGLDGCTNLSFATGGTFYGGIYAPNAMLNLKTSVELYGSFVTKTFLQALAANVHYDASLKDPGPDDPGVSFSIKRWWE
jgi:hypothetical protein